MANSKEKTISYFSWLTVCIFFPITSVLANSIQPALLVVDLSKISISEKNKVCEALARPFTVGRGPFGYGIGTEFSCLLSDSAEKQKSPSTYFSLDVLPSDKKTLTWTVSLHEGSKVYHWASITLAIPKGINSFFKDKALFEMLATYLQEEAPISGFIDSTRLRPNALYKTNKSLSISTNKKSKLLKPPKEISLFELVMTDSEGTPKYQSKFVANLKITSKFDKKNKDLTLTTYPETEVKKALDYMGTQSFKFLAIQNTLDPEGRKKDVLTAINSRLQLKPAVSKKSQLKTFAHLGLRLGLQFLPGDTVIKKSQFLGLVASFGSGWLDGLRFYYDWQPKVRAVTPAGVSSLNWHRLLLAWSFDFELPPSLRFLADRIDILPRIGTWTFATQLPIQEAGVEEIGYFSLSNKLSTGIELGAEKNWQSVTARFWYGRDVALSLFGLLGSKSVTSDRFGLDLWWDRFPKGYTSLFGTEMGLSLLAFSFFEDVALEDSSIGEPEDPSQAAIYKVNYFQAFAGLGVAMTW